jgi:hypothetical protein
MPDVKVPPQDHAVPEKLRRAIGRYVRAEHRDEFLRDVATTLHSFSERGEQASYEAYVQDVIVSLSADRDSLDLF